jgi:hypothetical protein
MFGNVNNNPDEFEYFKKHEIENIPYKKRELNKIIKLSKEQYINMEYDIKMFDLIDKNKQTNHGKLVELLKTLSPGIYKKVWIINKLGFTCNSYFYNKILKHKMVIEYMKKNNIKVNRYNIIISK